MRSLPILEDALRSKKRQRKARVLADEPNLSVIHLTLMAQLQIQIRRARKVTRAALKIVQMECQKTHQGLPAQLKNAIANAKRIVGDVRGNWRRRKLQRKRRGEPRSVRRKKTKDQNKKL